MEQDTKVSRAQQAAVHRYVKANYDRLDVTIPKGQKEVVRNHAAQQGESVNGFVWRSIRETITRDQELEIAAQIAAENGCTVQEVLDAEGYARTVDRLREKSADED